MANANIPAWLECLDILLSKEYKDYKIITSRNGIVKEKEIRKFRKYLNDIYKQLERLGKRKSAPQNTGKLVDKLFAASDAPVKQKTLYAQRLQYGLLNYYTRTYFSDTTK